MPKIPARPYYQDDTCRIYHGDCLKVTPKILQKVSAIVTDPPYGLKFMNKEWDRGVPGEEFWKAFLDICKPGTPLLAFGGCRTQHRLVCAIEDAGWLIANQIYWVFGQGFPKAANISKNIDKAAGAERGVIGKQKLRGTARRMKGGNYNDFSGPDTSDVIDITAPATEAAKTWEGWYGGLQNLKPAAEVICYAMKPLDGTYANNALKHGVAGLNVDASRVGVSDEDATAMERCNTPGSGRMRGRDPVNTQRGNKGSDGAAKGLDCQQGRWPANLIHDGSDEVVELFPNTKSGKPVGKRNCRDGYGGNIAVGSDLTGFGDSGSAARFFYCAKATKKERGKANDHPTVKPLTLMKYLVKLVTPPNGGIVLDPFMGSGSTLLACQELGIPCIGIDDDKESVEIAVKRLVGAKDSVERESYAKDSK